MLAGRAQVAAGPPAGHAVARPRRARATLPRPWTVRAGRRPYPVATVTDRRHRRDLRDRRLARSERRARRRRPVGAVVRAVPDARPDPREGGRRDRRQGGAGQGQRRREPAGLGRLPGAEHPRGVRPARTARWSTASSAPRARPRCGPSSSGCCRSEPEIEIAALLAAGDEASLRRALELEPDHEPAIVALAELLVDDGRGRRGARAAGPHPRDGRRPAGSPPWPAPATWSTTSTTSGRRSTRCSTG